MQRSQNCSRAASPPPPVPAIEALQGPALNLEDMDSTEPDSLPHQSSPADSTMQSPAPSPSKVPLYKKQHWDELEENEGTQESLAAHPASDQAASEYNLKMMLLSSQKDLCNDFRSSLSSLHSSVDQVEERTNMLERQITENASVHHKASEAYHHYSQEIQFYKLRWPTWRIAPEEIISSSEVSLRQSNLQISSTTFNNCFSSLFPNYH